MTDTSLRAASLSANDFRLGRVFSRAYSICSRNFLTFGLVMLIANAPSIFLTRGTIDFTQMQGRSTGTLVTANILGLVLGQLALATVLYASFQDMSGRPVDLLESAKVGLRRFVWVILMLLLLGLGVGIGFVFFIVPGLILLTMWFVAIPVCVVERLGPIGSLGRSRKLTKGYRWKILGLVLLLYLIGIFASLFVGGTLTALGGTPLAVIGALIWSAIWGTFASVVIVVTYHDLRVAKEGVDTEQIISVFD
jgi:hypothetical protein